MDIVFFWTDDEVGRVITPIMITTAKALHPNARIFHLTDLKTPEVEGVDETIRADIEGVPIMVARLALYYSFVQQVMDRPCVFVDTDVFFLRSFEPLFDGTFDVGLTWRKDEGRYQGQVFNIGVFLVANTEAAKSFVLRMAELVSEMDDDKQKWFGDQEVLLKLAGGDAFHKRDSDIVMIDGVRVGYFPCEIYNYTPNLPTEDFSSRYLLHFKGELKQMMVDLYKLTQGQTIRIPAEYLERFGQA